MVSNFRVSWISLTIFSSFGPEDNAVRLFDGMLLELKGIDHLKPIHTLEILNVPGDQW